MVSRTANGYRVDMGPWAFIFPEQAAQGGSDSLVAAAGLEVDRPALSISMGNPHTVVALADLSELAGTKLGEAPVVDPGAPVRHQR